MRVGAKQLGDVLADSPFWLEQRAAFFNEVSSLTDDFLLEGAQQAEALGLGIDFDLVNRQVLEFARAFNNEWWSRLDTSTRNSMRAAITKHIETGAPLPALKRSLEPLFGKARAKVIAATEMTRLYAEGNRIAYKSAGIEMVEFQTVRDAFVDPICDSYDGRQYPIDFREIIPPIHPGCRCWLAPITAAGDVLKEPAGSYPSYTDEKIDSFFARIGQESVETYTNMAKSPYSKSELDALSSYRGLSSGSINNALREGGSLTGQTGERIAAMDSAFRTVTPLPEGVTVFRGLGSTRLEWKVGNIVEDRGFMSTTLSENLAKGWSSNKGALLEIRVPAGSKAIQISGVSGISAEAELLLPRSSMLRIVSVTEERIYDRIVPRVVAELQ